MNASLGLFGVSGAEQLTPTQKNGITKKSGSEPEGPFLTSFV